MVFSEVSDPRNLLVWKAGFKDWKRAEDVQELAALIYRPPPLPKMKGIARGLKMSQGAWRSAAAIGVSVAAAGAASGIFAALAALPIVVALDWATRRRRQFARTISSRTNRPSGE